MVGVKAKSPRWVFDRLPPSGARRGGDPSEHAFDATLATFVREVIQNANDQAIDQRAKRSRICFDHFQLTGSELDNFCLALDANRLLTHVSGAIKTSGTDKLIHGRNAVRESLSLLRVADYHTHGLTGDEDAEDSHFRSLCKDTLLSYKQGQGAGGSYGLGKSVLWSFSSLSTVLFSSSYTDGAEPRFRLIGRAELPSHKVDDNGFSGSGWFGLGTSISTGERAESVWDEQARKLAEKLHLNRSPGSGTSILVVGFRDPATDEDRSQEKLLTEIRAATGRHFWPALTWPGAPLEIFVDGQPVDVRKDTTLRPMIHCWQSKASPDDQAGNVLHHEIAIELPRRRSANSKKKQVQARLSLRIGESSEADSPRETAVFRGPGMIVERWVHNEFRRSSRPFHAVLACGLARSPESPTPEDRELEHFLRCCEPPGHDTWRATARVKGEYMRGYGKALQQLRSEVEKFIRKQVLKSQESASEAPAHIRELFPFFSSGSSVGTQSAFSINELMAELAGNCWEFEGVIRSSSPGRAWRGEVRLFFADEDGNPVGDPLPIASLILDHESTHAIVDRGVAIIRAKESRREIRFFGQSTGLTGENETHSAVCLEVNAQVVKS